MILATVKKFIAGGHVEKMKNGSFKKTRSQGAATYLAAAFDPEIVKHNGAFLMDSQVVPPQRLRCWARDPVEAEMLWKLSEEIVGQKFEY